MSLVKPCPCGSEQEYDYCCKLFHQGNLPENALLLMCSRYSAYALNIPEYLVETTHPASPQYSENKFSWKRSLSHFSRYTSFHKLEIFDFKEKDALAIVTFTAYISQEGQDATFTERSHFEKIGCRWFYLGGQLAQGHVPTLATTGQFKLLPLAYYGDPILRKKAEAITEMTADTSKLIEEMVETMDTYEGIGLAAPQIHHSIRLFVIRTPIEMEQDKFEAGQIKVFINPRLSLYSEETWKAPEGCLSIPAIRASVERPKEVTVEYTSVTGKTIQERVSGWEARAIMHEYDHLEGILFIDRLEQAEQSKLGPFLHNLEKRIQGGKAL
ncbi:Peptide deformylase [Parachlamydia sp. AcF125]|nr:Peptide deformylase [Parachlamydia sp. AcF125]